MRVDRRRVLAGAPALLAGATPVLAGCGTGPGGVGTTAEPSTGTGDGSAGTSPTTTPGSTDSPATTDATETPGATDGATSGGALDLREANVTGVTVERSGDEHTVAVTLYHDDDGEDGYADWWQVETLAGERIGRRKLVHAHGTREFTRSDTFALPDVDCVVVRGHEQTHGYGGQAVIVTPATGATRAVPQGSEPASFADANCA